MTKDQIRKHILSLKPYDKPKEVMDAGSLPVIKEIYQDFLKEGRVEFYICNVYHNTKGTGHMLKRVSEKKGKEIFNRLKVIS